MQKEEEAIETILGAVNAFGSTGPVRLRHADAHVARERIKRNGGHIPVAEIKQQRRGRRQLILHGKTLAELVRVKAPKGRKDSVWMARTGKTAIEAHTNLGKTVYLADRRYLRSSCELPGGGEGTPAGTHPQTPVSQVGEGHRINRGIPFPDEAQDMSGPIVFTAEYLAEEEALINMIIVRATSSQTT